MHLIEVKAGLRRCRRFFRLGFQGFLGGDVRIQHGHDPGHALVHDTKIGPDEVLGNGVGDVGTGQDDAGAETDFAVGVIHLETAKRQLPIDAGEKLGHGGAAIGTGFVGDEGADGQQEIAVAFLTGDDVEIPKDIAAVETTEQDRTVGEAVVLPFQSVQMAGKKGQDGFFRELGLDGFFFHGLFHCWNQFNRGV